MDSLGGTTKIVTLDARPDLHWEFGRIGVQVWPRFIYEEEVGSSLIPRMRTEFSRFQLLALAPDELSAVACARAVPFSWDGGEQTIPSGWAAVLDQAFADREAGRLTEALSAISAFVQPGKEGQGLGRQLLEAMRTLAQEGEFLHFVAPVRPILKDRYPLTPMERYVRWRTLSGDPFDPWIRTHGRIGGEIVKVADNSMTVTGSVRDWEEWTSMRFPESGQYVVPGALVPIVVDREVDQGSYVEPNVWMRHSLD